MQEEEVAVTWVAICHNVYWSGGDEGGQDNKRTHRNLLARPGARQLSLGWSCLAAEVVEYHANQRPSLRIVVGRRHGV